MTSSRPYLLRALHEWIVDNGLTPYLLVDASQSGVDVPQEYVQEGKIVLNIAPRAVQHLDMGNDFIRFGARFSGVATQIDVPVSAVLAIYAMENGQGMVFNEEDTPSPEPPEGPEPPPRPSLKVVK